MALDRYQLEAELMRSDLERRLRALEGQEIVDWRGRETALAGGEGGEPARFEDFRFPLLQFTQLDCAFADGTWFSLVPSMNLEGGWSLELREALPWCPGADEGIYRTRDLGMIPRGVLSDPRIECSANGYPKRLTLRVGSHGDLLLVAGEVYEHPDGELDACEEDESVLLFLDPSKAATVPWRVSSESNGERPVSAGRGLPLVQVRFVHRQGERLVLKRGRRPFQVGLVRLLLSVFLATSVLASGVGPSWLGLVAVPLACGAVLVGSGPRTVVDLAAQWVELPGGRRVPGRALEFLRTHVSRDSNDEKAQTWCQLEARTSSGETLLLAEGASTDAVEKVGREIADRLGVAWQDPGAVERMRRTRFARPTGRW